MKKIAFISVFIFFLGGFGIQSLAQITEDTPIDGVYKLENMIGKTPVAYQHVREADVVFSRKIWRVIDFKEKKNHIFYFPEVPHQNWRNLMTVIMDGLESGELTAYDASSMTDEFAMPLNFGEIMNKFESVDTQRLQRPTPPYEWYDTVVVKEFSTTDVKKVRIKEEWFFDKQRSVMDVRIIGICPVRDSYNELGEFRGFEPLFWIYFPEARNIFARSLAFNPYNSSQRLTFDDIFWKRMFASFVYKEDNVYDRRISEYAKGIDALIESERIKKELFEWEENLWEY